MWLLPSTANKQQTINNLKLIVNIPEVAEAYKYYTDAVLPQNKAKLDSIKAQYGSIINYVSKITNVPVLLIIAFIFIESSSSPNAISPAGAVGLMQLKPASASDILVMEKMKNRLRPEEATILTKYLGARFTDGIMKMKYLGNKVTVGNVKSATWVTKDDLLKPELNILIGSIYLAMLLAEESKDGKLRLDRVVVRYNKGYRSDLPSGTVHDVLASTKIPNESKDYIRKLLGVNGVIFTLL